MKNRLVWLAVFLGFLASSLSAAPIGPVFAETADELAGRAIDLYKKEQKELKESLRVKEQELNKAKAAIKKRLAREHELEQLLSSSEREFASAQKDISNLTEKVGKIQQTSKEKDVELTELNGTLNAMRQQRDELQVNYSNLQGILDDRGNQLTKAQTSHVKLTEEYDAYKGMVQQEMDKLVNLQRKNKALLRDQQALHRTKSELDAAEQARSTLETKFLAALDQVKDLSEKYENSQGTYAELLRQLQGVQGDSMEMEAQLKASQALAADRLGAKEELAKKLEETTRRFTTLQTSRSLLLQQVGELEERVSDSALIQRELAKDLELQRATVVAIPEVDLIEMESLKKSLADAQLQIVELSTKAKHSSEQLRLLSVRSSVGQYKQEAREAQSEVVRLEQELRQEQFNFQREYEQLERKRTFRADEQSAELRREKFSLQGRVEAMEEERNSLLARLSDAEQDKLEFQEENSHLTYRIEQLKAAPMAAPQTSRGDSETLRGANQELSRLQEDLKAQKEYSDQLKGLLNAREEALADQQEAMRRLKEEKTLQRAQTLPIPFASAKPAATAITPVSITDTASAIITETPEASERPIAASSKPAETVSRSQYVKSPKTLAEEIVTAPIFAVTEALGFVVLDVKGIPWAQQGTRIQVLIGDDQILEMEIGEKEQSGLAIAQVLGDPPIPFPFKVGDTASIRRIQ